MFANLSAHFLRPTSRDIAAAAGLSLASIGAILLRKTTVDCETEQPSTKQIHQQQQKQLYQEPKRQVFVPKVNYPGWDYDWDRKSRPELDSLEDLSTAEGYKAAKFSGKTRHIILIRHGQYDETHTEDENRHLTELGKRQAHQTGLRLATMAQCGTIHPDFTGPCRIKAIHVSDMVRAKETAAIIASHLPGVPLTDPDPLLNEALPSSMIPMRPDLPNAVSFFN
jgi:hypothetical protein